MRINLRRTLIYISSVVIFLYLIVFILDIVYPEYLGVNDITTLLAFRNGPGIIPHSPSLSHGWELYMGTTYNSILLFPALLGSLKFDFTVMLASLFISSIAGITIGFTAAKIGRTYRKFIIYITKIFSSAPYILIMLLILYVARPMETGMIIAISIGWFPFYILRSIKFFDETVRNRKVYSYKKILWVFVPYFITDIGALTGVVTIITYFGFYFHNPFIVDIGNIMYLDGNINIFMLSGVWWVIMFPLIFITIFIGFTALLSYELNGGSDDATI